MGTKTKRRELTKPRMLPTKITVNRAASLERKEKKVIKKAYRNMERGGVTQLLTGGSTWRNG